MEDEYLKSSLSTQTTLISQSSSLSPITQADDCYSSTSTSGRSRSQVGGDYTSRSSRPRRYYRTNLNTRKSRPSDTSSNKQRTCPQCLSPRKWKGGDHDPKNILQRLSEMDVRQEQLFTMLQRGYNNGAESPISPYAQSPADRFQPSFDISSSSSLQKYIQTTLHPDPVQLCDTFLARYNLPYLLSRSYDPIELIHMHGWEQEGYGDVTLVLEDPRHEALPGVEVPWKHIDQAGEPRMALKVSRLASQIKEHWLYQGRSVRNSNDVGVPFETDEFAHTILFLNCPGYTNIMLYQSGYDSSGAHFAREPWLSGKRSLLCQLQPDDDGLRVDQSCPWDGKVFGRLWQVWHHRRLLSFACIYLALSQMSVVGGTSQRILGTKKTMRFLSCYASKWPRFMRTSEVWVSPGWIHLHFHLRVLSAGKKHLPGKHTYWPNNGLRPARVSGKLSSLNGLDDIGVFEERFSIAVVSSYTTDMPSYTIFYISDSEYRRIFLESDRPLDMPGQGRFTGVAVYLKVLLSIIPIWMRNWVEALNEIDNLVGVKIDDLFDPKRDGTTMMFDSTFERSQLYFTVLQTLRIISEWVHESGRELHQLKRDFYASVQSGTARRGSISSNKSDAAPNTFIDEIDKAWEELIALHNSSCESLLNRIEKKEEDIKSFRDGLFSATSVREASRATAMNQYILVFTFVTIFYLPLGYASSLFSMDIFTYDSTESNQSSFFISTVTIALVTWAVAAVVLWLVHDDRRLLILKSWLFNSQSKATHPQRHTEFKEPTYDIFQGV